MRGISLKGGETYNARHICYRAEAKIREAGRSCAAHLSRAGEHHGRPIRTFLRVGGGYGVRGSSVWLLDVLLLVPRRVRFFYL